MKKYLSLASLLFILNLNISSAQSNFQQTYSNAGHDLATGIIQTYDGGYLISGYTDSVGAGSDDGYLIKTDANGDTLWTKTYGGIDYDMISAVKQTFDSGYIFTGYTTSFGAGAEDVYLIKTDAAGNPLWQRTFGGVNNDVGNDVIQTKDGGYIVVGQSAVDSLVSGVYIIKTNSLGDSLWTKVYSANNNGGNSIYQTNDGGYIITGSGQEADSGNTHVYLLKIDSNGTFLWNKYIGGAGSEYSSSVQQTNDHGFIITGYTNSFGVGLNNAYLIKTDSAGNITWSKTYGGSIEDEGAYGQQTSDGGYFVIGETGSFGIGIKNYFFIKTDANGDTLWTKTYATSPDDIDFGATGKQTSDGGYILAGFRAVYPLTSHIDEIYVVKTDSAGNSCYQTNVPAIETIAVSSFVSPPIQQSTGSSVSIPVSIINSGCTVTSLCLATGINENAAENNSFSIYPNPANNQFTVYLPKDPPEADLLRNGLQFTGGATLEIYNMLGEVMKIEAIKSEYETINCKSFASGIYFVKVTSENASWMGKLIKE